MTLSGALLEVAQDLTAAFGTADRHARLLAAVRQVVHSDAACLLGREGDALVVLAARGLASETLGRRFDVADHPRLDAIARAKEPILFPRDSTLPDPFDGLLEADASALAHVHACLGCPLRVDGQLVGVLAADALDPSAFDHLDRDVLAWIAAIAAAVVHTGRLMDALERTARRSGLVAEDLMRSARESPGHLVGESAAVVDLRREIEVVAATDLAVLISGETGTGKELVARAVHAASRRSDAPMLYVNCAALPETVAESELFGHVRGAFTGAHKTRPGKFEVADGGTLFLDEIGELPMSVQPKLLRAIQEGEVQRVGADRPLSVDVRIIAATNRDLDREVEQGRFRQDLCHRLRVYPLFVPPLRERKDDVALLAGHFADLARAKLGLGPVRLSRVAIGALSAHDWPGNVRELEHEISRAVLRASVRVVRGDAVIVAPSDLFDARAAPVTAAAGAAAAGTTPAGASSSAPPVAGATLKERVDEFQRREIRRAVEVNGGNWSRAARDLGLHRSNLHHLARRLGLG